MRLNQLFSCFVLPAPGSLADFSLVEAAAPTGNGCCNRRTNMAGFDKCLIRRNFRPDGRVADLPMRATPVPKCASHCVTLETAPLRRNHQWTTNEHESSD